MTKKKALIVYGGWEGHDPQGVAEVFQHILKKENFEVELSDTLESFEKDLSGYDLLVPVWTMGSLSGKAEENVCAAVAAGVGIAGCHVRCFPWKYPVAVHDRFPVGCPSRQ